MPGQQHIDRQAEHRHLALRADFETSLLQRMPRVDRTAVGVGLEIGVEPLIQPDDQAAAAPGHRHHTQPPARMKDAAAA